MPTHWFGYQAVDVMVLTSGNADFIKRLSADLDSLFPVQGDRQETGPELPNIPGYEVEAVLGRGGIGIIYRVRHVKLNRAVALKMLLSAVLGTPVEFDHQLFLSRFARNHWGLAA